MPAKFDLNTTNLHVTGIAESTDYSLAIDGQTQVGKGAWRDDALRITLPLTFFDGREHNVKIDIKHMEVKDKVKTETAVFQHRSDYVGALDFDGGKISGWICDTARPTADIAFDVECDGVVRGQLLAKSQRENGDGRAFVISEGFLAGNRPATTLGLRIRGTDYYPFGTYLIGLDASVLASGDESPARRDLIDRFGHQTLLEMARAAQADGAALPFPSVWRVSQPSHNAPVPSGVDVIIPVYRGKSETLACIRSVLAAKVTTPFNLIVINDASPDEGLTRELKALAAEIGFRLLNNATNLGFVATVNRGMSLDSGNDVVLLNADTLVADGWLDRLRNAAYRGPRIATVTPLSNNATICSLPDINGTADTPYGLDLKDVNALCQRENGGLSVAIPTGHGFCMFIRRAALREIGLFDAETFGKGYGEENDFSLRAAGRGWQNLAACDVFVYHKGSVSFENRDALVAVNATKLREIYPDYDTRVANFIAADPMAAVRNRLQIALWREKPTVVFLSLATGGGVDTNIHFLAQKLASEGFRVLIGRRASASGYAYELAEWNGKARLLYPEGNALEAMCSDILILSPRFIHLHHLIDMEDGLDRFLVTSGIPYFVTLHDFFYLCPRVTLLDDGGEYSLAPTDENACNTCLKRGGAHRDMHGSYDSTWPDIVRWRDKWHDLLKNACQVIAPSEATAAIYHKVFGGLTIAVRPHLGPQAATVASEKREAPAQVKIALLGGLLSHKGYETVVGLLRWAEKRDPSLRFSLIGYSDKIEALESFPNLENLGPYTADTLAGKITASGCQVALFVSPWPETYSYTLSEALSNGLTPVTIDLGAPGERVRALGVGITVLPDAGHAKIVAAIREAATQKILPGTYSEGDYGALVETYYRLQDIDDSRRADCIALPNAKGLEGDRWAKENVTLHFAARSPVNRLKIDLYIPASFGQQQVRVHIDGEDYGLVDLPPEVDLRRLDIPTRDKSGLIRVDLTFSFMMPLPAPDTRIGAAKLGIAGFFASDEPILERRPNPISVHVRPSPDLQLQEVATVDESGQLEAIYRDVARYTLFNQKQSLLTSAKGLVKDLMWTARIGRRQGPKNALQAFVTMRSLRRSSFDETFYRLQLGSSERRAMDPVNHYVVFGAREGFDPVPGFSTDFYLKAHGDLAKSNVNPFFHFLRHGWKENRRIEPSEKIGLFMQSTTMLKTLGHLRGDSPLSVAHALTGDSGEYSDDGVNLSIIAASSQWPKRDRPGQELSAFDLRPDDDILDIAYAGKTFLEEFRLDGHDARLDAAIKALNALPRPSLSDTPDVSVVVPVYGQIGYTLNCLHALLQQHSHQRFEILIGDDASTDRTEEVLKQIEGIRYIRYDTNEGFIANCNKTAAQARGKFLVFLNNDTRVGNYWLDRMIESFSHFPEAGIVGSKLFYPDGSLQEAGGIVWKDGSAWNYGRNDDPNLPAYCYARAVDYVSGASFTIRTETWTKLGGFDERYKPAYYEDTDLAFRIRELGQSVIMQPLSKVVHYEGKTSGTDTGEGVKAYQVANRETFLARWRTTLEGHRANGDRPELERDRKVTRRVLIVDACNPTPDRDAGSKATVDMINYYRILGYQVSFVPEDNFLFEPAQVQPLQALGVQCFYGPYARSMTDILSANGKLFDVIHLIRANVAHKCLGTIGSYAPQARIVFMTADLHFLRMQRQADIENNDALRQDAIEMKARELELVGASDVTLVHSEVERAILEKEVPHARVEVLPLIESLVEPQTAHAKRKDIMFLGGYNHPPNVDAARFLLDEVWPRLSKELPEARLLLVGADAPDELKQRASDRVIVTGKVDSLAPWFDQARVFVAPLRYGAGVKGKVIAALAHGVPVVATEIAAEGLPLEPGITVFRADTAAEIADQTLAIWRMGARDWNRLVMDAQDYILDHHSFPAAVAVLKTAIDD